MNCRSLILFLLLFCSAITHATKADLLGKNMEVSVTKMPDVTIDAGTFYNNHLRKRDLQLKNPFDFWLTFQSIERKENTRYTFYPYYNEEAIVLPDDVFEIEFDNHVCHSFDKRVGNYSDQYRVYFINPTNGRFYCDITVHYTLIKNQTSLVQVAMDSIDIGVNDTIEIAVLVRNTSNKPVKVLEIVSNQELQPIISVPFTIKGNKSIKIPIKMSRGDVYGEFSKSLKFVTNENIEKPEFYARLKGEVIGTAQPKIVFDAPLQVKEKIPFAGDGYFTFWFTNTGELPLIIYTVKSGGGGIVPSYSREPYPPGARGKIEIRYDTKRVGSFNRSITLKCNATQKGIQIRVQGSVLMRPNETD